MMTIKKRDNNKSVEDRLHQLSTTATGSGVSTHSGMEDLSTRSTSNMPYTSSGQRRSKTRTKRHRNQNKKKGMNMVWAGRLIFVACLTLVAVGLAAFAYETQASASVNLANSLFVSMTDRALLEGVRVVQQKQRTITTLAQIIGALEPNASVYPFTSLAEQNWFPIVHDLRQISNVQTLGFLPFVLPEQQQDFEQHALEYFASQNFSSSTGANGIFTILPNGTRVADNGQSSWGSPYTILVPAFEVETRDHPISLYNVHSEPNRGKPIDNVIDCVLEQQQRQQSSSSGRRQQQCTTLSEFIMPHKEPDNRGPSSGNYAPVFPANDPTKLVGISGSLIVWEDLLQNAFANQVSGIDCVITSTQGEAFTYTIEDGIAIVRGTGDLHDPTYNHLGRSVNLTNYDNDNDNDPQLFAPQSIGYTLSFYPNQQLYQAYNSGNPTQGALITAGIVGIVSLLFLAYDFVVRREFSAKKELLESKRKFMRFISHECRTPLNSVCMSLCVVRHEIAMSLGYPSADVLQSELDDNLHNARDRWDDEPRSIVSGDDNSSRHTRSVPLTLSSSHDPMATSHSNLDVEPPELLRSSSSPPLLLPTSPSEQQSSQPPTQHRGSLIPVPLQSPTREMALEWFNTANDVLANTQSAVEVLSDLLNYDKIESSTLSLELTKIPIWQLLESTMEEFRLSAANKRINLQVQFYPDHNLALSVKKARELPLAMVHQQVVGDEVRLQQVFRNLLSNAIKFTPEQGNITVRASWWQASPRRPSSTTSGWANSASMTSSTANNNSNSKPSKFQLKDGEYICLPTSGNLELEVEDSGVGMTPAQLSKLCSAGVQFNVNDLQGGKGSGLGMHITKGIIEQHQGILEASSPGLGHGTKITVTLPLYDTSEADDVDGGDASQRHSSKDGSKVDHDLESGIAVSQTTNYTATSNSSAYTAMGNNSSKVETNTDSSVSCRKESLRVLVVDDIPANRKLLGRLLQINGHSFDQAEDGRIAVEQVQKALEEDDMYDSILLDFEMPVMNGPDAAKEIRQLCPSANIVGITGNMLSEDVALFKECGANEVMGKPFKMQILEGIWRRHGILAD